MKFKIGDRVRLLQSVIDVNVPSSEVGKTGEVTFCSSGGTYLSVQMDFSKDGCDYKYCWSVNNTQVEPVIKVGEQLLFNFMGER